MVEVSIPTDLDGYIRRECPTCEKTFKWHVGPIDEQAGNESNPEVYYCPLCGAQAPVDHWWTPAQLEYAQAAAMPDIAQQLEEEFAGLTFKPSFGVPPLLTEPDDMEIIVPPCHDYEPVKVPDIRDGPFFCLVCGGEFAI